MSIVLTGASGLRRRLTKLSKTIDKSPKRLVKIVSEARNRLHKRTNKGLTATGGSFTPLNDIYATRKVAAHKKGIPDLHYEGHMLRAMQVKQIRDGAMIYFNNATERKKAVAHHFGRGVPRRSFFRLGKKIETYIFKELRKPIKKVL